MIRLENISHDFEHSNYSHRILENINLHIEAHEVFGLIGQTGSGKSSLLRIMNGFLKPLEGDVFLMGKKLVPSNQLELVRRTATLFQHFNLLSNLNVLDNVLLPNKLLKQDVKASQDKARYFLKYVGLEGFENRHIKTLSGGQKQRVAIARTLMREPQIIFCDEPTSALDGKMREEVLRLLENINKDMGTTIVIVSHDIEVIQSLSDRVAILEDGKISKVLKVHKKALETPSYEEVFGK